MKYDAVLLSESIFNEQQIYRKVASQYVTGGIMAEIINCSACGKPVPDHLFNCPYCKAILNIAAKKQTSTVCKCPKCDMEISDKALKCPYCRSTVKTSPITKIVVSAIGIFILFAIIIAGTSTPPPAPPPDPSVKYKSNAQEIIKGMLKTPSVAKFDRLTFVEEPKEVIVTGEVDSQNSYGAMIRRGFVCHFPKDNSTPFCNILSQ